MAADKREFLFCPMCGKKTRVQVIRGITVIHKLPLFCPKCHRETVIDYK